MMMSTSKFKVALVAVQELEATIIVNEALLRFSNVSLCNDPKPEPEKWRTKCRIQNKEDCPSVHSKARVPSFPDCHTMVFDVQLICLPLSKGAI